MGGLLVSVLLSLFVLPVLYTLLIKDRPDRDVDIEKELEDRPEVAVKPVTTALDLPPVDGQGKDQVLSVD